MQHVGIIMHCPVVVFIVDLLEGLKSLRPGIVGIGGVGDKARR